MKNLLVLLGILAFMALVAGCDSGEGTPDGGPKGEGLFVEGCPVAGKSMAKMITNPKMRPFGPDALAVPGDYLLMNENAAFVVTGTSHGENTFWYYPGIIVDAVAIDSCDQASQERFEELWLMMGNMNLTDFPSSVLRAFNGTKIEVANDGSDGKAAVVRVTGFDDMMWFIEDQLMGEAAKKYKPVSHSKPLGLEVVVEYSLSPGSQVVNMNVTYKNTTAADIQMISGCAGQFGDSTPVRYYANSTMNVGSWKVDQEVPWVAAAGGDGAWVFAMKKASMGTTSIVGVAALMDMSQILSPMTVPAGGSMKVTYLLAVGGTDSNSAVSQIMQVLPEPVPGMKQKGSPLSGKVTDSATGAPIPGVLVELQMKNTEGAFRTLDSFYTGKDGLFFGVAADFKGEYRLVAKIAGRNTAESATFSLSTTAEVNIQMNQPGVLKLGITDKAGHPLPTKVLLWKDGDVAQYIYSVTGAESEAVPPGDYDVSVTRGFEYTSYQGVVTVPAGGTAELTVQLDRVVDSAGYLTVDQHCHAGPSPDNYISIPLRVASTAAEGLEVVISTDHEAVGSWQSGIDELGLSPWLANVIGTEVTANLPEHSNAFPLVPDYSIDERGGFIHWYGLDLDQIYAAERKRGASIVQLNHPRNGCGWMCMANYDRLTGETLVTDPTTLGFSAGQKLWSWEFDVVEFQNGPAPIFIEGDPRRSGMFDDWQSFINLGHTKTAVGNSDAHNYEVPGTPRNFFASTTDDPAKFVQADMIKAIKEGRVVVSNGAFIRLTLDGQGAVGDIVTNTTGKQSLGVHIEAPPEIEVAYFKVYVNCDQVAAIAATAPDAVVKFDGKVDLTVAKDANIVVAAFGTKAMPRGMTQYDGTRVPRATTNPIYLDADGDTRFTPPGSKGCTYDLNGP